MTGQRLNVKITLKPSLLNPYLGNVSDLSAKRAAGRVRDQAKANAPRRTGALAESIQARAASRGIKSTYRVGTDKEYAIYQEEGTGPIVARAGGILRFSPRGMSVAIFRPRTRGAPATHFLRRAFRSLSLRDFLP